jgi:hypothetical protein
VGQLISCSRNDALGAGLSYPALTVNFDISQTAPSAVTNTALVSGGGELDTNNDTGSDGPTPIKASADTGTSKGQAPPRIGAPNSGRDAQLRHLGAALLLVLLGAMVLVVSLRGRRRKPALVRYLV